MMKRGTPPLLLVVNIRLFYGSYWESYIYLHYVFRLDVLCFSIMREADKGGFCYWCGFDGEEVGVIFDREV